MNENSLFNPEAFEQMPGQMSMDQVAPLEPLPGESPEDTARWARIFARAKTQPASTPGNNVWD